MRPMESDGDHFLSYYLTQKDEDAIQFKQNRVEHLQQCLAENPDDDELEKPVSTRPRPSGTGGLLTGFAR